MLRLFEPVRSQHVDVEGVADLLGAIPDRFDVVTLRPPFESQQEEESRERRMFQERVRELRDARLALVEIPAERVTARLFEHRLRPLKQLLMLQLLFAEADERAEVGPVALPVLLHDVCEVEGNELL